MSRRCSTKTAKHQAARVLASAKLNTVHSHIFEGTEGLSGTPVCDDEYKLILLLDEVETYRAAKEELRRAKAAGSVIDEETKILLFRRGRDQAYASIIKKLVV